MLTFKDGDFRSIKFRDCIEKASKNGSSFNDESIKTLLQVLAEIIWENGNVLKEMGSVRTVDEVD